MRIFLDKMKEEFHKTNIRGKVETHLLYPGIGLMFVELKGKRIVMHHDAREQVLEIHYCMEGRSGREMKNGTSVYLGAGDCSLHMMNCCADSVMILPNEYYKGIVVLVDLEELRKEAPEILKGTEITGEGIAEKFCGKGTSATFSENDGIRAIFGGFLNQPERLRTAYWKIKAMELLLYLEQMEYSASEQKMSCQAEQTEIIKAIHEQMTNHLEQRFTIESLSRQYLMNPTTLKNVFKEVYGTSIAAHVKEHRMELAAKLLADTTDSVAQIAKAVGYDNQSKFTANFKSYYRMLPTDYRKQHGK